MHNNVDAAVNIFSTMNELRAWLVANKRKDAQERHKKVSENQYKEERRKNCGTKAIAAGSKSTTICIYLIADGRFFDYLKQYLVAHAPR